ncbi:MAG: aminotransferase class III-fold pyridoxal phosphate-dependent enzyme [Bdellovibrionales bacterium]|nr:aminotransferase class III-fold pyridoxal phosphate-dependent enzyme [Bdellovibrionales bacterium]
MSLVGHKIKESNAINQLIKNILTEIQTINSNVSGIRPPQPECKDRNDKLMKRVEELRGRGLYYPYVGTGAGNGVYVELEDGSTKIDLINGIGIHILGHSHPKVIEASLRGSLSDILMQGNLQLNQDWIQLSERLVNLASKNSRLKYSWITTSGSMANENAIKMARQKNTPARKILSMYNEFAGRTTLMTEISDNPSFKVGLPTYDEVLRVPFFSKKDARSSEKALEILRKHISENPKNISSFMFEPMQGEGGYRVAPREYFIPLLEECRKSNIAVIADEIQTFCRTGEMFAFEKIGFGDYVDICTVAKTVQVGVTLYTEEYNPKPGLIAGTFAGSTPQLTVGAEILRILTEEGYTGKDGKIQHVHNKFVGMLEDLGNGSCKGQVSEVEGLGLMIGFTAFDGSAEKQGALLKKLYANGVIAFGCGRDPYRVRFLVPAIITDAQIQEVGDVMEKSIKEVSSGN